MSEAVGTSPQEFLSNPVNLAVLDTFVSDNYFHMQCPARHNRGPHCRVLIHTPDFPFSLEEKLTTLILGVPLKCPRWIINSNNKIRENARRVPCNE
jgi:hypothetical protein